jgi:hypothetical protein
MKRKRLLRKHNTGWKESLDKVTESLKEKYKLVRNGCLLTEKNKINHTKIKSLEKMSRNYKTFGSKTPVKGAIKIYGLSNVH